MPRCCGSPLDLGRHDFRCWHAMIWVRFDLVGWAFEGPELEGSLSSLRCEYEIVFAFVFSL